MGDKEPAVAGANYIVAPPPSGTGYPIVLTAVAAYFIWKKKR